MKCTHPNPKVLRYTRHSSGKRIIRVYCNECGEAYGGSMVYFKNRYNMPEWIQHAIEDYEKALVFLVRDLDHPINHFYDLDGRRIN